MATHDPLQSRTEVDEDLEQYMEEEQPGWLEEFVSEQARRSPWWTISFLVHLIALLVMWRWPVNALGRVEIESAVALIEHELSGTFGREIDSSRLGELVMRELRKLDEVAYVRFASVYRAFEDVDEFVDEAKRIETVRRDDAIRRRTDDLFDEPS